jgi:hypothetical protein
MATAHRTDIS